MFSVIERGPHWSVRPRVGEGVGTGRCSVCVLWPLALQRVRATLEPAQLRISVAKRVGSGLSCVGLVLAIFVGNGQVGGKEGGNIRWAGH